MTPWNVKMDGVTTLVLVYLWDLNQAALKSGFALIVKCN